mgnify:CR=1 FL=1|jgi:RNA polymerase primary sigma factor
MNEKQDNEMLLWQQYKNGDSSVKKTLIRSLEPVIKSQVNRFRNSGLPIPALELEGKRLAGIAIDSYDPTQSQLNTHVINNLKKLSRFSTTYQNIGHIPEPRALLIGKYNTIYANLEDDLGREPTLYELADRMHIPPAEVNRLQLEMRNDLQMELPSDEDEGGFYMYVAPEMEDRKKRMALDAVYDDADNINRKILEYRIPGLGNDKKLSDGDIKLALGLTETDYRKRRDYLADQLKILI